MSGRDKKLETLGVFEATSTPALPFTGAPVSGAPVPSTPAPSVPARLAARSPSLTLPVAEGTLPARSATPFPAAAPEVAAPRALQPGVTLAIEHAAALPLRAMPFAPPSSMPPVSERPAPSISRPSKPSAPQPPTGATLPVDDLARPRFESLPFAESSAPAPRDLGARFLLAMARAGRR